MKMKFYFIPFLGLMLSCAGESKKTENASELSQPQNAVIEQTTNKLEDAIKSSDLEIENAQREIDTLLNGI